MVTLTIRYDDKDLEPMVALLERLRRHSQHLRPVFADMGEALINSVQDRFDAQKAPDGTPWEPVSPAWWRRKRIKKILTESSNLRDRIVHAPSDRGVEVGTNVVYAGIHQFGGEIQRFARSSRVLLKPKRDSRGRWMKRKSRWMTLPDYTQTMPARPFLGLSDGDQAELQDILQDHLKRWTSG